MIHGKNGVIVIGGHVQGLNIVRIYAGYNIPSIVLDETKYNLARHSKYCVDFYKIKSKESLLDTLILFMENEKYRDWLLLPTDDYHVQVLSKNKDFLSDFFIVGTDSWNKILPFYNKRVSYKIAKKLGMPIADTWFPDNEDELDALNDITFPCILKPAVMHSFYEIEKQKVFICKDKQELLFNYKRALKVIPNTEIIIQNIIPGKINNQYSACFLYNRTESVVSIVARRRRQHPIMFGSATTYAETIENPILLDYAERILKHVQYKGICEVEFMYDASENKYKFLEVNPRSWKWHSIAIKANTPFLFSLFEMLVNKKIVKTTSWNEAAFRHILTDFPTILKLYLKGLYTKPAKGPIQYAVWSFDDIMPALYELLYLPRNLLKR